jgi:nitrous oxide reductase accessory protein NosL
LKDEKKYTTSAGLENYQTKMLPKEPRSSGKLYITDTTNAPGGY